MGDSTSRIIGLTTDDRDEAFDYLMKKRGIPEEGWDMAEVRWMRDPPRTIHKWCVFRTVLEEEEV